MKNKLKNTIKSRPNSLIIGLLLSFNILSFILAILAIIIALQNPKIGYVRSADLIYGYIGMKEAQNRFQEKAQQWQANLDTIRADYQKALGVYHTESPTLSQAEKYQREKLLKIQETNLLNYSNRLENQAKEEDQKMTQGVLNQINSFVEQYGRRKGYDIILGTTLSGNILFGIEALDITKEVLAELNQAYYIGNIKNVNLDEGQANETP